MATNRTHLNRKKAQPKSKESLDEEVAEGSIKWNASLGKLLAYKLREEYTSKYVCGTRISVAKQWALELGLGKADPRGLKTKAAVTVMLKKYWDARAHYDRTRAGDIVKVKVVEGVEEEVTKTLTQQCIEICPHWEILYGYLTSIDEETCASGGGLGEMGMKGSLSLGLSQRLEDTSTQVIESQRDDITEDKDNRNLNNFRIRSSGVVANTSTRSSRTVSQLSSNLGS